MNGEFHTRASFVNHKNELEKLTSTMKIEDRNSLYYESRSSAVNNAVDYTAEYKRRN